MTNNQNQYKHKRQHERQYKHERVCAVDDLHIMKDSTNINGYVRLTIYIYTKPVQAYIWHCRGPKGYIKGGVTLNIFLRAVTDGRG